MNDLTCKRVINGIIRDVRRDLFDFTIRKNESMVGTKELKNGNKIQIQIKQCGDLDNCFCPLRISQINGPDALDTITIYIPEMVGSGCNTKIGENHPLFTNLNALSQEIDKSIYRQKENIERLLKDKDEQRKKEDEQRHNEWQKKANDLTRHFAPWWRI